MSENTKALAAIAGHVMLREVGDEAVLLDLNTETYFGLDPVALSMLQCAVEAPTVEAAVRELVAVWDAEPAVLQRDLEAFLEELVSHGLLESPEA